MGELSRDILKQRNARNAYFYWIKWNSVNTYERVWNVAVRRTPCPPVKKGPCAPFLLADRGEVGRPRDVLLRTPSPHGCDTPAFAVHGLQQARPFGAQATWNNCACHCVFGASADPSVRSGEGRTPRADQHRSPTLFTERDCQSAYGRDHRPKSKPTPHP